MANRSDFLNAKVPRANKRVIALGEVSGAIDKNQARAFRKMFAEAHAHHVAFKLKRNSENNRDASDEG